MIWTRGESTSCVSGPWIVAKVTVCGADRYELRHTARPDYVASFASFDSAKREAERLQLGLGSLLAGGEESNDEN